MELLRVRMDLRIPIISALLLLPVLASHAADETETPDWYTIEVVIFSQGGTTALESEQWPNNPGIPNTSGAVELFETATHISDPVAALQTDPLAEPLMMPAPQAPPAPFQRLAADQLDLDKVVAKLKRHPGYHTLLHLGWHQPGVPREQSQAVHLNSQPFSTVDTTVVETQKPTRSLYAAMPFLRPSEPVPEAAQEPGVEGTVRLYLRRYLHLEVDLLYDNEALQAHARIELSTGDNPESTPFSAQQLPVSRFRLKLQRRLRSGEIHYLDHPLFGLIVKVMPFELPPERVPEELNIAPALNLPASALETPAKQP